MVIILVILQFQRFVHEGSTEAPCKGTGIKSD